MGLLKKLFGQKSVKARTESQEGRRLPQYFFLDQLIENHFEQFSRKNEQFRRRLNQMQQEGFYLEHELISDREDFVPLMPNILPLFYYDSEKSILFLPDYDFKSGRIDPNKAIVQSVERQGICVFGAIPYRDGDKISYKNVFWAQNPNNLVEVVSRELNVLSPNTSMTPLYLVISTLVDKDIHRNIYSSKFVK